MHGRIFIAVLPLTLMIMKFTEFSLTNHQVTVTERDRILTHKQYFTKLFKSRAPIEIDLRELAC